VGKQSDNENIARILERVADLLELQEDNPFRIRSYRQAARVVRDSIQPVEERLEDKGVEGLKELPGVGEKIAGSIEEIVQTGRLRLLDTLEAETSPETAFTKVPGVGRTLAARIRSELDIETLEELEQAAHDGRLEQVSGVGRKRAEGIRNALAGMLSRSAQRSAARRHKETGTTGRSETPPVDLLLEIDAEYREKAGAGELRTIAPRRFNPEGKD